MYGSSFSTSGWGVCITVDKTGTRHAVVVCAGAGVEMTKTDVDTSWASGSSVLPGDEVENTCTGDTVVSS